MKKAKFTANGMKQIIDSGYKLFDKQTNIICDGNVIANTEFGNFIRPWKEIECNGRTNPPGHLTKFDLEAFEPHRIPKRLLDFLLDKNRDKAVILYMFFVVKNKHIVPFSFVITSSDYKLIDYAIIVRHGQSWMKLYKATMEAISYITD